MARNFAGSDRIAYSGAMSNISNLTPVTLALRIRTTQASANVEIASRWTNTSRNGFGLLLNSGKLRLVAYQSFNNCVNIATAGSVNDGNWHAIVALIHPTIGGANAIYVDGVSDASGNTVVGSWSTTGTWLTMGDSFDAFWTNYVGEIADVGYWHNVHLTADEIAAYAKGFSARMLRPDALELYAPLVRDHQDRMGNAVQSFVATTVSDHPRVIGSLV